MFFARLHGVFQGTADVTEIAVHDFITLPTDRLSPSESGDVFGGAIETGDPPLVIYGKYPFADAFQDGAQTPLPFGWREGAILSKEHSADSHLRQSRR